MGVAWITIKGKEKSGSFAGNEGKSQKPRGGPSIKTAKGRGSKKNPAWKGTLGHSNQFVFGKEGGQKKRKRDPSSDIKRTTRKDKLFLREATTFARTGTL